MGRAAFDRPSESASLFWRVQARAGDPQEGTSDSMDIATLIVVGMVIATALVFDFTNGFHDTANAMATSIATGALKPKTAVLAAGALNLVGAFLSTEVAKTISGGHHQRGPSGA